MDTAELENCEVHADLRLEDRERRYCLGCYEKKVQKRDEDGAKEKMEQEIKASAADMAAFFGQKPKEKVGNEDDVVIALPLRGKPPSDQEKRWKHLLTDQCRAPSLASYYLDYYLEESCDLKKDTVMAKSFQLAQLRTML